MGTFDDLIPQKKGGTFDDLIPAKPVAAWDSDPVITPKKSPWDSQRQLNLRTS